MQDKKIDAQNMCALFKMFLSAMGNFRFPDQDFDTPPDAIVILSAPHTKRGEEIIEDNDENRFRIQRGVSEWRQCDRKPRFILSGEPQQLWSMTKMAHEAGMVKSEIATSNCGNRGVGNTNTQFQTLAQEPLMQGARSVLVITTDYHIPRVYLNAIQCLPGIEIRVAGIESESISFDFSQVGGEIGRIIAYCNKKDIAFPA